MTLFEKAGADAEFPQLSAGRSEYRVVFRIDESKHLIVVRRIDHRRDVYRP